MSNDPQTLGPILAQRLGETEDEPRAQLMRLAAALGRERCERLLEQAHCVQDKGGLLAPDGARQRTLGGVFFWLARGSVTYDERRALFPSPQREESAADLAWWHDMAEARALAEELRGRAGEVGGMKLTLTGRPSGITVRTSTVVFVLEGGRAPALPKGMPPPGNAPPCLVVVPRKQWERVSTALEDPQDSLIIEGYPTLDDRFREGLTVYVTKILTKTQVASARAARQMPGGREGEPCHGR